MSLTISTYVLAFPTKLNSNLRKMLAAKFFRSSNDKDQETPWLQNSWRKDATTSTRNIMN